ncbi:MAG: hypothetical protein KDD69_19385, partial [Bdellovibrionales bacterium]|nr:hypothetical protein [Bdellovibrionales bacterium]
MAHVVIAGCGDIGTALGERLAVRGISSIGLRRSLPSPPLGDPDAAVSSENPALGKFKLVQADLLQPETYRQHLVGCESVVYLATPDGRDEAAYRRTYVDAIRTLLDEVTAVAPLSQVSQVSQVSQGPCQRVFYVSST